MNQSVNDNAVCRTAPATLDRQITARRGEEGGHAVLDDTGAEVHDSLGGLQRLDQLLLVHVDTEAEKYKKSMVKK